MLEYGLRSLHEVPYEVGVWIAVWSHDDVFILTWNEDREYWQTANGHVFYSLEEEEFIGWRYVMEAREQ